MISDLFRILFKNSADLGDGRMTVIFFIDYDNGSDGAAAKAGDGFQGELAVLSCLPGADVQLPFEFSP